MKDNTAAHITKAIKNGVQKCRDEVLSPLASPCWPEKEPTRDPATFHSLGRYVSAGVKKKIGVRRLFGFKNQGTKGSVVLVPEKNASRGKWKFWNVVHLFGHVKIVPENMLRMEGWDFGEAGNFKWGRIFGNFNVGVVFSGNEVG